MESRPRTFADRTNSAARAFLRSALVVDDELDGRRIENARTPRRVPIVLPDPTLEGLDPVVPPEPVDEASGRLNSERIVRAFADQEIVCATLRPDSGGFEHIVNVARRADLVTLDWSMDPRPRRGKERLAISIIKGLVNVAGRRVVAIYTKDPNIGAIAKELERLPGSHGDGRRFEIGSLTVVILLKPDSGARRGPDRDAVVSEEDLPAALINEFAKAAGGLLANATLRGLAQIRDRTPSILASLGPDLDIGYIAHRFLLDVPRDAEDHAVVLIAAEAAATLTAKDVENEVGIESIRAWIADQPVFRPDVPKATWGLIFRKQREGGRAEAVLSVLRAGLAKASKDLDLGNVTNDKKVHRKVAMLFAGTEDEAKRSEELFAERMSVRSSYGTGPRRLGFGTLLTSDSKLYVSIQPACDAVHLSDDVRFPLLCLRREDGWSAFDLVLADGRMAGRYSIPLKFRDLELVRFHADADLGAVIETTQEDGERRFVEVAGEDARRFEWIGELRESTALRIAKRVADRLSRIGLDESEWLRRSAPADPDEVMSRELERRTE
jgi:hypothetical protein